MVAAKSRCSQSCMARGIGRVAIDNNQCMKTEGNDRQRKHPVPYKEFDRLMRAIRDQARGYPQEALEDIFVHLEMIEKRHGISGE